MKKVEAKCELNLWGIETEPTWIQDAIIEKCELNLWGIETITHYIKCYIIGKCELNLWGIETWFFCSNDFQKFIVWIEPVRDWNSRGGAFFTCRCSCVNWTCEGLKRNILPLLRTQFPMCELNLWGIETLEFPRPPSNKRYRVNWTCEGLKQIKLNLFFYH